MNTPLRRRKILQRFTVQRSCRSVHRWIGIALFFPFLILAVTGSLLTRPDWFREGPGWRAYAVSPADPDRHARSDGKSVWMSRDSGSTFSETFPPGGVQGVVGLAFAPKGTALFVVQKELGLLKEEDGIWESMTLPFDPVTERVFLERLSLPKPGSLVLETSGSVWMAEALGGDWRWKKLATFEPSDLYRELHAWHSGWRFGNAGMRVVEILGWMSVLLAVTGLVLFFRVGGRRKP